MILSPRQYGEVSTYELLCEAGRGVVPKDHLFLRAIVEHPEKSVPDLVRYGLEEHADEPDDLTYDLIRIAHHLKSKEMTPFLIKVAREHAAGLEDFVIEAFQSAGEAAVEPLLELYRAIGKDDDTDVAFLLATLGVHDPRIFDALLDYLAFDAVDGAHCLAAYGDPAAIPAMEKAAEAASESWEQGSIRDSIGRLREPEASGPDELYDIWEDYPEEALPSFDDLGEDGLIGFFASPEAEYRAIAINTLSTEQAGRHADRLFELARQDADANVRACCWQALTAAWERNDIRDAVRSRSRDTDAPAVERAGAVITLAQSEADCGPLRPLLLELYEHPEAAVRSRVLRAMSATLDPRYEPYLVRHLDDADPLVVSEAIQGAGIMEIPAAAQKLTRFFNHEDHRIPALSSYALSAPSPVTRRGMRDLYEKISRAAGGLDKVEDAEVKNAINIRLARNEAEALFDDEGDMIEEPPARSSVKVGRNDPCPCGSGKKYKKCCGAAA